MILPPPPVFHLPYPSWRPHQAETITQVLDTQARVTVIQAPTGIGKTAIALGLLALCDARAAVLTATKGLQDQYLRDAADLLTDIRGANNYACLAAQDQHADHFPTGQGTCDEGPCLVGVPCDRRRPAGCLYFDAQRVAIASDVALTSYAYWLAAHRFSEGLGARQLLILDEAHDAPDQLAAHLELAVSAKVLQKPLPSATTTIPGWRTWARGQLDSALARAESPNLRPKSRLQWKRNHQLLQLIAGMQDGQWVAEHRGPGKAILAPIEVAPYVEQFLFCRVPKIVLMSATVTPETLQRLGLTSAEVTWIALPSPFPAARRPIIVVSDAGRIDHRLTDEGKAWWSGRIAEIIERRLDRKGLIHTVSYARQQDLLQRLAQWLQDEPVQWFIPRHATELRRVLKAFKQAGPGSVLISPAIVTGFDFPYRDAEYQIISKVPFPDTRSPIMKARLKADPDLRATVALQGLIQAAGRIVRAVDDQGETFITDEHATWFLRKMKKRGSLPAYVLKAIRITDTLPQPPPPLTR